MVSRRFCGFLLIVMWNLHIVHKALQYGCTRHHGLEVDSMAIGLHGWFKIAPCKREDIYIYILFMWNLVKPILFPNTLLKLAGSH